MKKIVDALKLLAIFALVAVLIISGEACGSKQSPAVEPSAPSQQQSQTGNRPPVISSLTPASTQVSPSGLSEIQIVVMANLIE